MAHQIKFDYIKNIKDTMNHIIQYVSPDDNLVEFALYDFKISYRDKWNNPIKESSQNQILIVRDWQEDMHVQ